MRIDLACLGAAAILGLQACGTVPSHSSVSAFSFALIGDVPYAERDVPKFDRVIDEINSDTDLKWVLHAGDIKSGSSRCSDELFAARLKQYDRFGMPMIITPGDNEWTDCHRPAAGEYQPLERLAKFRQMYYPAKGWTLGNMKFKTETQANDARYATFVENMRWTERGIVFATLHIVGSNNGSAPFDAKSKAQRSAADDKEVDDRTAATLAWIAQTFEQARTSQAPAVFLLFQANLGIELPAGHADRKGFEPFIAALESEAIRFGKPVILAHGDSHYFRIDKPMIGSLSKKRIENITRVETSARMTCIG